MLDAVVHRITAYPLRIGLRGTVTHTQATRSFVEPIIIEVEMINGVSGFGEAAPREYVTGETTETVIEDLRGELGAAVQGFHARSFPECLELIEALPWRNSARRRMNAARAGVELALLDASMKFFGRDCEAVVQWMGLAGFGLPGSSRLRLSGVLAAEDDRRTLRKLRMMYWYGLRDFKLKVGYEGDVVRLARVARYLQGAIGRKKASLRVDANGAWSPEAAAEWITSTAEFPLDGIEQPVKREDEKRLLELRDSGDGPVLFFDESLIDIEDAKRLADLGGNIGFNIRISKCGGLLPSLRIAAFARRAGIPFQLGCMVGETSLLAAAGLRFLQTTPGVQWAEGCFGTWLLEDDVSARSLRFGLGGRQPKVDSAGLGTAVSAEKLRRLAADEPVVYPM